MFPRRMMIAGAIMVLASVALNIAAPGMIGGESTDLIHAARFDGSAGNVAPGALVVVEGKISAKNKTLVHDFVDAAKEHQVKGGSWSILQAYRQPVIAELARGEVILNSENLCTEAKGSNILAVDEKSEWGRPVRFIGLKNGDPITAVGTLSALSPAALTVKSWYSGSAADYQDYLASSMKGLRVFCAIIAVLGVGLFLLGFIRR